MLKTNTSCDKLEQQFWLFLGPIAQLSMAYVYILQNQIKNWYYLGSTTDLARRLIQHERGDHSSSKRIAPFKLVFKQEYNDIREARYVERRLKKLKRRDFIEKIIKEGVIKIQGPLAQSVRAGDS